MNQVIINIKNKLGINKVDIIFMLFILFCAMKQVVLIEEVMDISLYDESYYLSNGVRLIDLGLPDPSWAPLYSIWYWLLSFIEKDLIDLFYLNYKISGILIPLLIYTYMRTLLVKSWIAILCSFLYLVSKIQIILPRPTHFALAVILVGLIIANTFTKKDYYLTVAITLLLSSFARPEYFLSFITIAIIYIYVKIPKIRSRDPMSGYLLIKLFVLGLITIGIIFILGNPLSGGRSLLAFKQHFSVNWVNWNQSEINPWTNHEMIVESAFGEVGNIYSALINNPMYFIKHLLSNVKTYFFTSININLVDWQYLPALINRSIRRVEILLLVIAVVQIIRKRSRISSNCNVKTIRHLVVTIACLMIAILPSSILIYPREHYLIVQGVMIIALIAYLTSQYLPEIKVKKTTIVNPLLIGLLLFCFTPNFSRGICLTTEVCIVPRKENNEINLQNLKTIQFIESLNIKDKVNLLEAQGGYHYYLGENYSYISEERKKEEFNKFAANFRINMVVVSENLNKDTRFINDEEFNDFKENAKSFGFVKLKIPGTQRVLFIEKELLERSK